MLFPPSGALCRRRAFSTTRRAEREASGSSYRERFFASSTTLFDDLDTDSDGFISPEEDKAALFRWYKERESASAED
jgi:hypothetical protein